MTLAEIPAAPVAIGGVDLAIALPVVCLFMFLLGLKLGYQYSLGALTRKLASVFRAKINLGPVSIGVPGGGAAASALDKVDHFVLLQLGSGLLATETVLAKWWHAQEALVRYTYDALAYFAGETHNAVDALVHGLIPSAIGDVAQPIKTRLGQIGHQLYHLEHVLERDLTRRARGLEAEIERDFGKAWRGIDHVRGELTGALAHVLGLAEAEIASLRGYAHNVLGKRLTLVEKLLGAGVLTAIGIAALTRVFPYWKCTNVRRFMRNVCRSPIGSLEWLFAFAALVVTAIKPREIVHLGTEAVGVLDGILRTMQGHPLYSAPVKDWQPTGRYAPRGT